MVRVKLCTHVVYNCGDIDVEATVDDFRDRVHEYITEARLSDVKGKRLTEEKLARLRKNYRDEIDQPGFSEIWKSIPAMLDEIGKLRTDNKYLSSHCERLLVRTIDAQGPVQWFADQMKMKLKQNAHKPGWEYMSTESILSRVVEELGEVLFLVTHPQTHVVNTWIVNTLREQILATVAPVRDPNALIGELADVANFCMMLADNMRKQ